MKLLQAHPIEGSASILAEAPMYHADKNKLYWTDIKGKCLKSYCLASGQIETMYFGKAIGSFAFVANATNSNTIIAATEDGFEWLDIESLQTTVIVNPEYDQKNNRFNDGKCDQMGRFFAGTMDDNEEYINGALYCLDGQKIDKKVDNLFISNGLGWSTDSSVFYLVDSPKRAVYRFDYDLSNAKLSHQSIFVQLSESDGYPDGLCVDSENCVWLAHWDGWKISRYTADGKLDLVIDMPVPNVSCINFGGVDFKTLFITTAKKGMSDFEVKAAPLSGFVFQLNTDVIGQKSNCYQPNFT